MKCDDMSVQCKRVCMKSFQGGYPGGMGGGNMGQMGVSSLHAPCLLIHTTHGTRMAMICQCTLYYVMLVKVHSCCKVKKKSLCCKCFLHGILCSMYSTTVPAQKIEFVISSYPLCFKIHQIYYCCFTASSGVYSSCGLIMMILCLHPSREDILVAWE